MNKEVLGYFKMQQNKLNKNNVSSKEKKSKKIAINTSQIYFLETLWQCNRRHFAAGKLLLDFKQSI